MSKIDQFESAFRSASKARFAHERIEIDSVLVVTDLDEGGARAFGDGVRSFLRVLADDSPLAWRNVKASEIPGVGELLDLVESESPDLICTYRNLGTKAWRWRSSLGDRLDVLAQATPTPVLVMPHPDEAGAFDGGERGTLQVSVLTDHLTGDSRLVNHGVRFTMPGGKLYLTHVEDEAALERTFEAISKIPEIDTDTARETIQAQLLKEPHDWVRSCREVLAEAGVDLQIEEVVRLGHRLSEHVKIIQEEAVDLVVLNTKDDDQLAMHGLAYPLAVELRRVPLLML